MTFGSFGETEIMRLVEEVAAARKIRPPAVMFRHHIIAWTSHRKEGTLILPSVSFLETHQAIDTVEELRLLVLHEMAHHLMGKGVGHKPQFFQLLFELCDQFGVDLEFALEDESDYKSRNAPKGYRMYMEAKEAQA